MNRRIFLLLSISSCKREARGNYSRIMHQCQLLVGWADKYLETHPKITSGTQFQKYISSDSIGKNQELDPGWHFPEENDDYLAVFKNSIMNNGRSVDILIKKNGSFLVKDHETINP